MPISFDDALAQTDPNAPEDQRKQAAENIMLGVRANEAYWDSRNELEQYVAQAKGHGVVARGADADTPTAVGTPTESAVIEGTATEEEQTTAPGPEPSATAGETSSTVPPNPDNPTEAVAKLRQQLREAGIDPEA